MKKGKPPSSLKWLLPKNDFVFKLLFGDNTPQSNELLLHFLNDVFNVPESHTLANIQILNPKFNKRDLRAKQIILDIHARIPSEGFIGIEMQIANEYNIDKRSLFYSSQIINGQIQQAGKYKQLRKTTAINLLHFNYFPQSQYHQIYQLTEKSTGDPYPDLLQLHFIELKKFQTLWETGHISKQDRLVKWIRFFTNEDDSQWEILAKEHLLINKAVKRLKAISQNPQNRKYYEMRQRAIMDIVSMKEGAREEGKKEGKAEGITEGKIEVAMGMLREEIDLNLIIKVTGFTKDALLKLKQDMNVD